MLTGRPELIQQASHLLPVPNRLDTLNPQGHTALMLAAIHNDETTLTVRIIRFKRGCYVYLLCLIRLSHPIRSKHQQLSH